MVLLSTSEYQNAILLPSKDIEAAGVARVAMRVLCGWLIVILLSSLLSRPISQLFEAPELAKYYWMLVPYVGAIGGWSIYNAWLTRYRSFGRISGYQLNQSATSVLTKLLFGWLGWLRSGLILSSVMAPLFALLSSVAHSRDTFKLLWQPCDKPAREIAHLYRRFPMYSMPRSLVNNLSGNLPALLLTPYFGLNELGFFAMAITIAFRPISMITASIHQVLFERVAKSVRDGQSISQWLRLRFIQLAAVVVPTMTVLTIIMPWLVRVFLGSGWEETSTLIRYMMPWLTCVFIVSPLAFISEVFGKQKMFLILEIIYLLLRIGAMVIGIVMNSFVWAIILMSAVGTIVLLLQLSIYITVIRRYESTCLSQARE